MRGTKARGGIAWLAVLMVLAGSHALACSVPVFRYALERWPPGCFDVTIYHHGPLPPAEQAVADALKEAADKSVANVSLSVVDVVSPTNVPLPWLTVDFPVGRAMESSVWRGPFTADTSRLLLDSPARRELARRLVKGDSIVWVVLDGDAASTRLLDGELQKLEKDIAIPPVDPADPLTAGNGDLKIAFSMLPVRRTDPAESVFVAMLLGAVPSLTNATGPVAFPIFGRGRLLTGLTGAALNAEAIDDAAAFVCGSCSCEVKELNPGVDLLIAADWEESLAQRIVKDPALPALVSLSTLAAPVSQPALRTAPVAAPVAAVTTTASSASVAPIAPMAPVGPIKAAAPVNPGHLRRNLAVALALVLGATTFGTLLALRRQRL